MLHIFKTMGKDPEQTLHAALTSRTTTTTHVVVRQGGAKLIFRYMGLISPSRFNVIGQRFDQPVNRVPGYQSC